MRKILIAAMVALLAGATQVQAQSQGVVVKQSAFSVKETLDRLEKVFEQKGIRVFARIDHQAGANRINKELAPAQVLIFGNPKIGTPLMQSNIVAGLDLPMKALAYQDDTGKVFLVYNHPGYLNRRHGIKDRNRLAQTVSRILINLTDQATKKQQ